MAARAMWKARLLLGEFAIPVKLYAAARSSNVSFRLLHEPDRQPIRQRLVDARVGKVVPQQDTWRAFELEEGDAVLLSPDELAELAPEASRDIELLAFVPRERVPAPLYDRPYYLGPDGAFARWSALAAALGGRDAVGIARWVMRGKRYRGALSLHAGRPMLVSLRPPETVVSADALEAPAGRTLEDKELAMARQLIGMLEGDFDADEFRNEFRERVLEVIEAKRRGGDVARRKPRPKEESDDLAGALAASLEGARRRA